MCSNTSKTLLLVMLAPLSGELLLYLRT